MAHHDVCYHFYANDTQVYLQCNNTEASILKLERCIVDICEWMKNNALKINRSKTDFIVFGSKLDHQTLPPLTICTDIIQPSETINIIGVTLDSQMNMQKDIAINTSTAALWNSLPNKIKCARNIRHFKKIVKLYMST